MTHREDLRHTFDGIDFADGAEDLARSLVRQVIAFVKEEALEHAKRGAAAKATLMILCGEWSEAADPKETAHKMLREGLVSCLDEAFPGAGVTEEDVSINEDGGVKLSLEANRRIAGYVVSSSRKDLDRQIPDSVEG